MPSGTEKAYALWAERKRRRRIVNVLVSFLVIAGMVGGLLAVMVLRAPKAPPPLGPVTRLPGSEPAPSPSSFPEVPPPTRNPDSPTPGLSPSPERIVPQSPARSD